MRTDAARDRSHRVGRGISRRLILALTVLVLLVLILGGVGWLTSWQSPVPVRGVEIEGAAKDSVREIREAADIRTGTAFRDVDVAGAVDRVVALPGIMGAELVINRPWTVAIVVDERHPVAQVRTSAGYLLLDGRGEVIRETDKVSKRIPLVVPSDGEAEPDKTGNRSSASEESGGGQRTESPVPETWATGVRILRKLPERFAARVATLSTDSNGRTQLTLRRGTVVLLGEAREISRKGEVAEALLKLKPEIINVTVPARPAVTGGTPAETPETPEAVAGH